MIINCTQDEMGARLRAVLADLDGLQAGGLRKTNTSHHLQLIEFVLIH